MRIFSRNKGRLFLCLALAVSTLSIPSLGQPDPGLLYQNAYFLEKGRGDIEGAVRIYERLVRDFPEERDVAARAFLRLGLCYEYLGRDKAEASYRTILDQYPEQQEVVSEARRRLEALTADSTPTSPGTGLRIEEVRQVGGDELRDRGASLSGSGRWLAFVNYQFQPERLMIQDRDTGEELVVDEARGLTGYRWSRDGRSLAYSFQREGEESTSTIRTFEASRGVRGGWNEGVKGTLTILDWFPGNQEVLAYHRDSEKGASLRVFSVDRSGEGRMLPVDVEGKWYFSLSPGGEEVACSTTGEAGNLLVISLEGASPRTVAQHPGPDRSPIWSPDGRFLAFLSDRSDSGNWDLWAVESAAGEESSPRLLAADLGEEVELGEWLEDDRLTFSRESRLRDIWALPFDEARGEATGSPFIATVRQGRNFQPSISPGGDRIAFHYSDPQAGDWILGVAEVAGDGENFVNLELESAFNPVWIDDERILLSTWLEGEFFFVEYDLVGRELTQWDQLDLRVNRTTPKPDFDSGGRMVFEFYPNPPTEGGLYYFDGSRVEKIPGSEGFAIPRFSAEGERVSAVHVETASLWTMNLDGSDRRLVVDLPEGRSLGVYDWSPGGSYLAYPEFSEATKSWQLRVVPAEGGTPRTLSLRQGLNPWWVDWSGDGRHIVFGSREDYPTFFMISNIALNVEP